MSPLAGQTIALLSRLLRLCQPCRPCLLLRLSRPCRPCLLLRPSRPCRFFCIYLLLLLLLVTPAVIPVGLAAFSLHFSSYFLHFENADFQEYDSEEYRINKSAGLFSTDDTFNIAYSSLRLKYDMQYKESHLFIDAMRSAHWGADNFQGRDEGQNPLLLNRLYFTWSPTPSFWLSFGRQRYEIGGSLYDYFFYDVIDGIVYRQLLGDIFSFSLLADIVSNSSQFEEGGVYSTVRKDEEQLADFRGDTISGRGGVAFHVALPYKIALRAFSYYLRYGATPEGGADLAENGRSTLNSHDQDYLSLSGVRLSLAGGELRSLDLTAAWSKGRDRQFEREHIYDDWAVALNASLPLRWSSGMNRLWLSGGYFGEGFASMKARSMGGMLLWGYKGYYAAPYAYAYHFRDYSKRPDAATFIDRTVPKLFAKLGNQLVLGGFSAELRLLALWQSEESLYMGRETEIELGYTTDNIRWSALWAIFQPSDYYKKLALTNVFFTSGSDPFSSLQLRVEYVLDLGYSPEKDEKEEKDKKRAIDRTGELLREGGEFVD